MPEPLPLRFGHISEVWTFLKETLPKYQWAELDKIQKAAVIETEDLTPFQVIDNLIFYQISFKSKRFLFFLKEAFETKDDYDKDGGKDGKGKNKTAKGLILKYLCKISYER